METGVAIEPGAEDPVRLCLGMGLNESPGITYNDARGYHGEGPKGGRI
jgi:hypothetical protein